MKEEITIEQLKKIIVEEGGTVSCVDMYGPVTAVFFENLFDVKDTKGNIIPQYKYDRYALEAGAYDLSQGVDRFRESVKEILDECKYSPAIFFPYCLMRDKEERLLFRCAVFVPSMGAVKQISIEEAKNLLKNPPETISKYFLIDMKNIYGIL